MTQDFSLRTLLLERSSIPPAMARVMLALHPRNILDATSTLITALVLGAIARFVLALIETHAPVGTNPKFQQVATDVLPLIQTQALLTALLPAFFLLLVLRIGLELTPSDLGHSAANFLRGLTGFVEGWLAFGVSVYPLYLVGRAIYEGGVFPL